MKLDETNIFSKITQKTFYNKDGEWTQTKPTSGDYPQYEVYIYTHDAGEEIAPEITFESDSEDLKAQKFIILMLTRNGVNIEVYNPKPLAEACGITDYNLIITLPDIEKVIPTTSGIIIHDYITARVSLIYNNPEYKGTLTKFYRCSGKVHSSTAITDVDFYNEVSKIVTKGVGGNVGEGLQILNSLSNPTYFSYLNVHKIKQTCPTDFSIYYGVG